MFPKRINLNDKYASLLDQAFLSVVNFGATLAFSKLAAISVFSAFVVTYSYTVAVYFIISLLISAPILVYFSKKWKNFGSSYFFSTIVLTLLINLIVTFLLFYFLEKQVEEIQYHEFFLLCVGINMFDVLKKFAFSVRGSLLKRGLVSTITLNLVFFGFVAYFGEGLSLSNIIFIYNISFFTANFLLIIFILRNRIFHIKKMGISHYGLKFPKRIFQVHFKYSKWLLFGSLAFWGYSQGIYVLAKYYDVNDLMIGKVRIIQNLLGVFNILVISLENYYMPVFSKEAFTYRLNSIKLPLKQVYQENYKKILFLFFLSVPIGLGVYHFLYLEKYGSGTTIFIAFIIVQFLLVCAKPIAIALKSVEHTKPEFWAHVISVVCMVAVLSALVKFTGGESLVIAFVSAHLVYVLTIFLFFRSKMKIR